jgi:hypothetical protein
MKNNLLGTLAILLILFLGIQLIPVSRTNPPIVSQVNWDSPQTLSLAQRACFDCHSNQTRWPWYSYVAPMSWLVAVDVNNGRRALNFSDLSASRFGFGGETQRLGNVVLRGRMPPSQYLLLHPDARLTPAEAQALSNGLQATFSNPQGN